MGKQAESCRFIYSSEFSQKFLLFPSDIDLRPGAEVFLSLFNYLPFKALWSGEQKDSMSCRHHGEDLGMRNFEERCPDLVELTRRQRQNKDKNLLLNFLNPWEVTQAGGCRYFQMCESAEMLNQRYRDVALRVESLASSRRLVHLNVSFLQLSGAINRARRCCFCHSEFYLW